MRKIRSSYRTAWRLTESGRGQLMALLAVITVFKIEVPLVIPYIIRWVFEAVEQGTVNSLFIAAGKGLLVFSANIMLMYFINVYGDAWAVKLAFGAAENAYKDMSKLAVADMKRRFSAGDLFNRVAAGTGQIVGLWFASIDFISGLAAVTIITILFALQANAVMGLALLLVSLDVIRVIIMYTYVNKKTVEIEEKRSKRVEFLKSVVSSHTFHIVNGTAGMAFEKYIGSRREYLKSMERKITFVAVCDAVSEVIHNIVVALLGRSYFELKQENLVTTGQVNSSYNLFSSLKNTADSYVKTVMDISAKFVPIDRLNSLLPEQQTANEAHYKTKHISYEIDHKPILKDISIEVSKGEKIAIIGDNGSGKSTILKCMSGILNGSSCGIHNYGKQISYMPAELLLFGSRPGYVNICMGKELDREEVERYMTSLSFAEPRRILENPCADFSGGERQRLAFLRAMVADPELVLLDEPTSALDEISISRVRDMIRECGRAVIYVTHLPELARIADRVYIIKNGEISDCVRGGDLDESEAYQRWLNKKESAL